MSGRTWYPCQHTAECGGLSPGPIIENVLHMKVPRLVGCFAVKNSALIGTGQVYRCKVDVVNAFEIIFTDYGDVCDATVDRYWACVLDSWYRSDDEPLERVRSFPDLACVLLINLLQSLITTTLLRASSRRHTRLIRLSLTRLSLMLLFTSWIH